MARKSRRAKDLSNQPLDYYSKIPLDERRVLQILQKKIGQFIPRVKQVTENAFGFEVENGHVVALGLGKRNLKDLPECMGGLSYLRALFLGYNELWKIPYSFAHLGQLETFDLRSNRLWLIPPFVHNLPSLERLEIAGNPAAAIQKKAEHEDVLWGTREYYKHYHGFDPETDKIQDPRGGSLYETWFLLENDPSLHALGVVIGARVNITPRVQNRIVFKRDRKEAEVTCIHAAITSITTEEIMNLDLEADDTIREFARTTENEPVKLSPEEHFAALKSYVQGIAEMGIGNVTMASYASETINPQTLPFGFNSAMQTQIFRCLNTVAPSAFKSILRDLLLDISGSVPEDWFIGRLELLNHIYAAGNIDNVLFGDFETFQIFNENLHSNRNFLMRAANCLNAHPEVYRFIMTEGTQELKHALLSNITEWNKKDIQKLILELSLHDNDSGIRIKALSDLIQIGEVPLDDQSYQLAITNALPSLIQKKPEVQDNIIQFLVKRGNIWIKKFISCYTDCPLNVLLELIKDQDWGVRSWASNHPRARFCKKLVDNESSKSTEADSTKPAYFNGLLYNPKDAKNLADLELQVKKFICTSQQNAEILSLVPLPEDFKIPVVLALQISSENELHKIEVLDFSNLKLEMLSTEMSTWLVDLIFKGCRLKIPQFPDARPLKVTPSPLHGWPDLRIPMDLRSYFDSPEIISAEEKQRLAARWYFYPFGSVLEFKDTIYPTICSNLEKTGLLVNSERSAMIFTNFQNPTFEAIKSKITNMETTLTPISLTRILEMSKKNEEIIFNTIHYNASLFTHICYILHDIMIPDTLQEFTLLNPKTSFPLLIRNNKTNVIALIAPIVQNKEVN